MSAPTPITETYPSGFTNCGTSLPSTLGYAVAYSVNITTFGSTANGSYGFLTAWPDGTTRPTTSTMNFVTGSQVSNAATIGLTSGAFDVYTT